MVVLEETRAEAEEGVPVEVEVVVGEGVGGW